MKYTYITASLLALLPVSSVSTQAAMQAPSIVIDNTIDRLFESGNVYANFSHPYSHTDNTSAIVSQFKSDKWLRKTNFRYIECEEWIPQNIEEILDHYLSVSANVQFPIIVYGTDTKSEKTNFYVTIVCIAQGVSKAIQIRGPNA
jgi:hypothetical protein